MKRILSALCFILLCLCLSTVTVSAWNDSSSMSWYCIRTKDHSRPPLPTEFEFINELGGHYIGKDEKVVYLTFDAGYENGNIKKTLNVLKENNVPAAFFVLSNLVSKNPELIKRMANEGHLICNHTSKHPDMSRVSSIDDFKTELDALNTLCSEKTGITVSEYFRPPEGRFNKQTLQFANELGYKTIFWSFAYADWDNNNQMSDTAAKDKILSNIHNGAIILLHPTSETNARILGDIISELKSQGYRFGTLDEL